MSTPTAPITNDNSIASTATAAPIADTTIVVPTQAPGTPVPFNATTAQPTGNTTVSSGLHDQEVKGSDNGGFFGFLNFFRARTAKNAAKAQSKVIMSRDDWVKQRGSRNRQMVNMNCFNQGLPAAYAKYGIDASTISQWNGDIPKLAFNYVVPKCTYSYKSGQRGKYDVSTGSGSATQQSMPPANQMPNIVANADMNMNMNMNANGPVPMPANPATAENFMVAVNSQNNTLKYLSSVTVLVIILILAYMYYKKRQQ